MLWYPVLLGPKKPYIRSPKRPKQMSGHCPNGKSYMLLEEPDTSGLTRRTRSRVNESPHVRMRTRDSATGKPGEARRKTILGPISFMFRASHCCGRVKAEASRILVRHCKS